MTTPNRTTMLAQPSAWPAALRWMVLAALIVLGTLAAGCAVTPDDPPAVADAGSPPAAALDGAGNASDGGPADAAPPASGAAHEADNAVAPDAQTDPEPADEPASAAEASGGSAPDDGSIVAPAVGPAVAAAGDTGSSAPSSIAPATAPGDAADASLRAPGDASVPAPSAADPLAHPLSIERLRAQAYPGSDLVFVETLPAGSNYSRHIVSYESEGNTIYSLFTVPNGERPATGWPVVIFNHGHIPPAQYRTTERYVAYLDAFARNGYIVLKSDYRGHGSSEGVATGGRGTPDYTIDVLNGMASVARYPEADAGRIGMWGHSMGGSITLRSMVLSKQIRAGVIWAGVVASYTDMYNRLGQGPAAEGSGTNYGGRRGWRLDLVELFGTPDQNPVAWNAVSPNAYLADISGPLQLHHGTADHSVPVEYSAVLQQQMEAAGRPSEYLVYEGDDHNLSRSLSLALQRSVAFFDQHLKGG